MINTNYALTSVRNTPHQKSQQNVSSPITQQSTKSSLLIPNFTYNQLQVKKSKISFAGSQEVYLSALEKKVSAVIPKLGDSDVLIFGDKLKHAQEFLSNIAFPIINKVHFVEEKGLDGAFAVVKNGVKNKINLVNLSKNAATLGDTLEMKPETPYIISGKCKLDTGNGHFYLDPVEKEVTEEEQNLALPKGVKTFDLSKVVPDENFEIIRHTNEQRMKELIKKVEPDVVKPTKVPTFDDIGGLEEVKDQLRESIVYPIKYPKAFADQKLERGILLYGPPGTGKTLIGRAIAGEANAKFYKVGGSELEDKYVGETQKHWRELFDTAKKNQPSVIFIDEADVTLKAREGGEESRYDNKTTNQILDLMSDLEKNQDNVFVVAATNLKEFLDSAMIRSGRFGDHIEIPNPDEKGCLDILNVHTKNKNISPDFNREEFAKKLKSNNVSGSDIDKITNKAKMNAIKEKGVFASMKNGTYKDNGPINVTIQTKHFDEALDALVKQNQSPGVKKKQPIGFIKRD